MPNYLEKINKMSSWVFILSMSIAWLLTTFTNIKLSPLVLVVPFLLVLVSFSASSLVLTSTFLVELIRKKNSILIAFYSLIMFISYKLSDVYTSDWIYRSLGYNPQYVPHTSSIVSVFSLILTGLTLTAISLQILSFGSILFISIFNSLIRPLFFFLNLNKLEYLNNKISDLGLGCLVIAGGLFFAVNFVVKINFNELIQKTALELDYYPIRNSASICKEAKDYEKFNYLSKNVISVYRYDFLKGPTFSVINCKVV